MQDLVVECIRDEALVVTAGIEINFLPVEARVEYFSQRKILSIIYAIQGQKICFCNVFAKFGSLSCAHYTVLSNTIMGNSLRRI